MTKTLFKEKVKNILPTREATYKIYIEDINPIIESTIIANNNLKNFGEDIINGLELNSYHDQNDIELESGENCVMLFNVKIGTIKTNKIGYKRYTICDRCQLNPNDRDG